MSNLIDNNQRKDKEKELKEKMNDLHPLSNFHLCAFAENISYEEDYVLYLVNQRYIVLVNLTEHDYIPSEFQIGYVRFRNEEEIIDYICDGNYVV